MWILFRVYGKSMLNHCTGWYKYSSIFRNICPTFLLDFTGEILDCTLRANVRGPQLLIVYCTLQGTNKSHLGKRKIILKSAFGYVSFLEGKNMLLLVNCDFFRQ